MVLWRDFYRVRPTPRGVAQAELHHAMGLTPALAAQAACATAVRAVLRAMSHGKIGLTREEGSGS